MSDRLRNTVATLRRRVANRTRSTVYVCGNCRETFPTEAHLRAHCDPLCPIVVIERQVAAWNARQRRKIAYQEAEFDV